MVNIRTTQQSQTHESTGECNASGSAQSALPCVSEYDINSTMRDQRRGLLKGFGLQLAGTTKQVGSTSSVAASSSTSVTGPTSSQPAGIFELVHQQFQRLMMSYH